MTLLLPGSGPRLTALGSTYTTKADAAATAGAYALVEEELWGDPTPLHVHTDAEEAFYVLSGEVAALVGDEETVAGPGTFLLVPRGVQHALRRTTDAPVRMLTLVSPPAVMDFFAAVVAQGEDELLADPDRLVALAAQHGTQVLGPHPAEQG